MSPGDVICDFGSALVTSYVPSRTPKFHDVHRKLHVLFVYPLQQNILQRDVVKAESTKKKSKRIDSHKKMC